MKNLLMIVSGLILLASCGKGKVQTTPGGVEYVNHTNLDGVKPVPGDLVYFHAQMRNGDSVIFGSRIYGQTPSINISAPNNGVFASPVEEMLTYMSVGDSVTMFVNLDTIDPKPRGFEDASVMYYDVVLLDVVTIAKMNELKQMEGQIGAFVMENIIQYTNGQLNNQIQTTETGLKYLIHEQGKGKQATPGKSVSVHYYGALLDGNPFDNSFGRGQSFDFNLGEGSVIPGWEEGISLLKEGAKATLFIPSTLGYGTQGAPPVIPPDAELVFYVELRKVN
jgi:FKBP-type peptidyl-prolyl cis-trans isomerase FkpA